MEIQIVKFFQGWASDFCDAFFWLITKMGEVNFFLLLLAIVFVCYSDKFALKLMFYYLSSVAFNNVIKLACKRPRPYIASLDIQDRLHVGGYSFPSGHTQGFFVLATTVSMETVEKSKKKSVKFLFPSLLFVLGVLVMLSRMYWGQHYLSDVVVGMMFGIAIPFFINFFIGVVPKKIVKVFTVDFIYNLFGCIGTLCFFMSVVLNLFGIVLTLLYEFSAVFVAMSVGHFVNKKKIKYVSGQGFGIGFAKAIILLAIIIGSYCLFNYLFVIKGFVAFLVYLFLGLICTIILPILFKIIFKKGYLDERVDN